MTTATKETDIIGGFPIVEPNCKGCGQPLTVENAWITDGCPCNSPLGVNSMNETRWRLLMQLQQQQARQLEAANARTRAERERIAGSLDYRRKQFDGNIHSAQRVAELRFLAAWLRDEKNHADG